MSQIVIIPTYNEKENISEMVHAVMQITMPFHVLVVDDGSPDGTAAIVKALQPKFPGMLHIEEREVTKSCHPNIACYHYSNRVVNLFSVEIMV